MQGQRLNVKDILIYSFVNDNSKRRMSFSCIGMGLVTGILYVLVRISEDVGFIGRFWNIIHFCYYNSNCSSGNRSNII